MNGRYIGELIYFGAQKIIDQSKLSRSYTPVDKRNTPSSGTAYFSIFSGQTHTKAFYLISTISPAKNSSVFTMLLTGKFLFFVLWVLFFVFHPVKASLNNLDYLNQTLPENKNVPIPLQDVQYQSSGPETTLIPPKSIIDNGTFNSYEDKPHNLSSQPSNAKVPSLDKDGKSNAAVTSKPKMNFLPTELGAEEL